ncbi:hypothetical protein [Kitasatospora viridis]|uniref:LppP/LprE lipoprotein n=1 Tax=Kitasatospora viridis TaxID=281105 RepID=A0A561UNL4_9ACTN|nr:hypothetical protein [Kitasatospora viridis]TWG00924.1 hypothetical protein FHX73_114805 [Kitasatospora viridis]
MPNAADVTDSTAPHPGPLTGHPPVRTGPWRWSAVAAGCAALVAAALAVAPTAHPADAATAAPGTPHPLPAAAAPDPAKAVLPLDCGPFPSQVALSFAADLGDGRPATVAAAHCQAGNGTAPDGVFVLTAGPDGTPQVRDTLLDWHEDYTVTALALRADGTITARASGYSTSDVPRCCPDVTVDLSWTRHGDSLVRSQHSLPAATT